MLHDMESRVIIMKNVEPDKKKEGIALFAARFAMIIIMMMATEYKEGLRVRNFRKRDDGSEC